MLDDALDNTRNRELRFSKAGPAKNSGNRISDAKAGAGMRPPAMVAPTAPVPPARRRLGLSLTQVLGSTGAAVTAAFLGSRLGVAGTLIGAALASVISVVGGALYTSSIKATRQGVAKVIVAVRQTDDEGRPEPTAAVPEPPLTLTGLGSTPRPPPTPRTLRPTRFARPGFRVVLLASVLSVAVFAGALAVVTGYEKVSGTTLSGGGSGGLTILGGDRPDPVRMTVPGTTTTTITPSAAGQGGTTTGVATTTSTSGASTMRSTSPTTVAPTAAPTAAPTTGVQTTGVQTTGVQTEAVTTAASSSPDTGAAPPTSVESTSSAASPTPAASAPTETGGQPGRP